MNCHNFPDSCVFCFAVKMIIFNQLVIDDSIVRYPLIKCRIDMTLNAALRLRL